MCDLVRMRTHECKNARIFVAAFRKSPLPRQGRSRIRYAGRAASSRPLALPVVLSLANAHKIWGLGCMLLTAPYIAPILPPLVAVGWIQGDSQQRIGRSLLAAGSGGTTAGGTGFRPASRPVRDDSCGRFMGDGAPRQLPSRADPLPARQASFACLQQPHRPSASSALRTTRWDGFVPQGISVAPLSQRDLQCLASRLLD